MIDRSAAPVFKTLARIELSNPEHFNLSNNTPVFILKDEQMEVLKLELLFDAGSIYQSKPLISRFTNELLTEGTNKKSSFEIAEYTDRLGSYLIGTSDFDTASFSLYALTKNLIPSLEIMSEILMEASFPYAEFRNLVEKRKQEFIINQNKVSYLAQKKFLQTFFGENHPYSGRVQLSDFDQLEPADLLRFFQNYYQNSPSKILVSGKIPPNFIDILDRYFGKQAYSDAKDRIFAEDKTSNPFGRVMVEKSDALQTGLRIGMPAPDRSNPDYFAVQLVNMVYGGYFGSRLMKNIREEKAYTYGISSSLTHLKHSSFWSIASEVGSMYTEDTIEQCKYELQQLQKVKIDEDELSRVKNYLKGRIQRNFDGVFSSSESLRSLLVQGLDFDYIHHSIRALDNLTADDLLRAANTYWNEENWIIVSAGKH